MGKELIFGLLGAVLLLLGVISGITLFFKAALGKERFSGGPNIGTLWGLFIICTLSGIIIVAAL